MYFVKLIEFLQYHKIVLQHDIVQTLSFNVNLISNKCIGLTSSSIKATTGPQKEDFPSIVKEADCIQLG